MNGELHKELRRMANDDKVSTKAAVQLMLGSQADMIESIHEITKEVAELRSNQEEIKKSQQDAMSMREEQIIQINNNSKSIKEVLDTLGGCSFRDNQMIRFGAYMHDHPKMFRLLLTLGLVIFVSLMNLWFIDGFRLGLLEWLHVPDSWIDLLVVP